MVRGVVIRVIVAIVAAVFVMGSWIQTGSPSTSLLSLFSVAVFVCTLALLIWDKWLWKTRLAQKIPSIQPDISGTWESRLKSLWVDPETHESPAPKTVYIVIRQTSSKISITLISDESKSRSSLARLAQEDESWVLHYIYTNVSRLELRKSSPIHHGSGVFAIVGDPVKQLEGNYWTDRDSKGSITLVARNARFAGGFEEARELFNQL